jgi:hypothetical protein
MFESRVIAGDEWNGGTKSVAGRSGAGRRGSDDTCGSGR